MTLVPRFFWKRSKPRLVGRGDPFDPRGGAAGQGYSRQDQRLRFHRWRPSRRWLLLVPVLLLVAPPLLDLMAGLRGSTGRECRLLSVVNGNTLLVQCGEPEPATRTDISLASIVAPPREQPQELTNAVMTVQLLGVPAAPILGARCLPEAWAGLRAQTALRLRVWFADDLDFTIRPNANVAIAYVDGHSVNHALRRTSRDHCAG
ncbi:hypothetical protein [Pararhodobacter zhoushanensis]|uniref:Uncharacterized protein n=1 Tax=Pararhodobacter zhoushanensis TaxID=2479545 RepID=A0ABT3H0K3_9RHOB|nr:hypothetical protein [Pararhodobacter zhoushanensis]MCW1933327.1 hypothetical protein [Pararhodobacter zhoushanensis]